MCFKIIDGTLKQIAFEEKATVVTYKAPPTYAGYMTTFPERVNASEINTPVDLRPAIELREKYGDAVKIYPGSMELRNGETYAHRSRTVCAVGVGDTIEEARQISLEGVSAIQGGALWHRRDIASTKHIGRSMEHMKKLRLQCGTLNHGTLKRRSKDGHLKNRCMKCGSRSECRQSTIPICAVGISRYPDPNDWLANS